MEFKGTKGKWKIDSRESHRMRNGVFCNVISTDNTIGLADVYGDDEEAKANALLISKAPEMLGMLKELLTAIKEDEYLHDTSIKQWFSSKAKEVEQLIKESTELN